MLFCGRDPVIETVRRKSPPDNVPDSVYSLVASACLFAVLVLPGRVAAAPGNQGAARLELRNETGVDQCIGARALERAVDFRLRRRAFRADQPATLSVTVVLGKDPEAGWTAQIAVRDAAGALLGTRSIASPARHCSSLDDSLALVVALLVDDPPSPPTPAVAPAAPPAPTNSESPNQPNAPTGDRAAPKPVAPSPIVETTRIALPPDTAAPREPWRLSVQASGALAFGLLPGVAPGVRGGVELTPPHGPAIELVGATFFTRRADRPSGAAGADFNASAFGLEICPLSYEGHALRWLACGGQSVGWVSVKSFGFDVDGSSSHLRYALLGSTALDFFLSQGFALRLAARGEVPLAREVFDYGARDGSEPTLYEMSSVAAVLDVGFLARL